MGIPEQSFDVLSLFLGGGGGGKKKNWTFNILVNVIVEKLRAIVHYRRTLFIEAVCNKRLFSFFLNQNSIVVLLIIYSAILHSWNFASKYYFVLKI